jgi:hypothetical protein
MPGLAIDHNGAVKPTDLTAAERRIVAGFPRGLAVDLGGGDPIDSAAKADNWGTERVVRAEILTRLLLGMVDAEPGYNPQLKLVGARVTGRLDLAGATVTYGLSLERCWLDETIEVRNAKMRMIDLVRCRIPAFWGWGLQVDGPVGFRESRLGAIGLADASIAGRLHLTGLHLYNPTARALHGTRLTVAHSVLCHDLTATGEVRLVDAHVGGALLLTRARFVNPNGVALHLHGIRVDQSIDCDGGFTAVGGVRLSSSRVAGQFLVDGHIHGTLDLSDAQIQTVAVPASLAEGIKLDGLTYTGLKPDEPVTARLEWLHRDRDGHRAQPYEQLAGHYRRLGQDNHARRVLLAKRRAYRATLPWWRRLAGLGMDALAGYGYAPGRALAWLVAAWLAGWGYFATTARPAPDPGLYALDLLLPGSPFGVDQRYTPHGTAFAVAVGLQAMGWALSLAVLPAVAKALNRS